MSVIKTPDQRVRVFISSTIQELADERKAAREAISNLRLIPVFFEAGARPHPPKDLYTAYLDQSHVFVGIYWNSYGWVAPGSEISGLEDEYRLCGQRPKLIYVKNSAERQPKLKELLKDIQDSDTACYQRFSDAVELKSLLENDLSVLMSEIFENALSNAQNKSPENNAVPQKPSFRKIELPLIKSLLIGRDADLEAIAGLVLKPDVSLVNILGAGGTGKTALSIHIAHRIKEDFPDGVLFVPLAPVTDAALVAGTIANVMGLGDAGKQPIQQTLLDYLVDKRMLLVLDNFEQVVEAGDLVSEIISTCSDLKIIVTSRTSLHIRGERIYNLSPLSVPDAEKNISDESLKEYPAIELFMERAREVNPGLLSDKENMEAIAEICRRLDGLPLAIELAASRTRLFQPAALLSRMGKTLDLVSKGQKDLPQRQQTLRAAIEWSYNLLDEEAKKVFRTLGVFKRSWTLEAADAILDEDDADSIDIEENTEKLLDVSLVKPVLVSHSSEARFNMLQTVHEYAKEMLEVSQEAKEINLKYAHYFLQLCSASEDQVWGSNSESWLDKMDYEFQNIRAAFYIFIENNRYAEAWHLFYLVVPYWYIRGGYSEAEVWRRVAKIRDDNNDPDLAAIPAAIKGKTFLWSGYMELFLIHIEKGFELAALAEKIFRETGDEWSLATALGISGGYGVYMGVKDATLKIKEAEALADKTGNLFAKIATCIWPSDYYRDTGNPDLADRKLQEGYDLCMQHGIKSLIPLYIIFRANDMLAKEKYEETEALLRQAIKELPEKGYKGFKGAFWKDYSFCLLLQNRMEEVEAAMWQALEYSRESGEMETSLHTAFGSSIFFKRFGNEELACKLLGAAEHFLSSTGYPLTGGSLHQYNLVKKAVLDDENNEQFLQWVEEGKKLTVQEAILLAMKK